jgi:hypothetical protein
MPCPSPEFVSDAPQRLRTDVEVQPSRLPAMRVPEKHKGLTPRVDHPRLLRMQGQAEPREQVVHPRPFSVRPSRRQQYEIIRIPNEPSLEVASLNALTETPVEQVEVHVREERRNDPALRRAPSGALRLPTIVFVDDGRFLLAARYSLRWRSRDFSRGWGWL